jgi:hypothetical protein
MPVSRVQHADPAGKVDVTTAFDIPDLRVLGAVGEQWGHLTDAPSHSGDTAGIEFGIGGHS